MVEKIKITPRDWKKAVELCGEGTDDWSKGEKSEKCTDNSSTMRKDLGFKDKKFQCEWTRDPTQFVTKPTPAYIKSGIARIAKSKTCAPVVKGAMASVDLFGCPNSCSVK